MTRLVILLSLTALTAHAGPAFPGGVIDSTERTAFVPAEDGVEAIDLGTGVTRWRSRDATWPLLVAGDQLIAAAVSRGSLAVVGLDLANQGQRAFRSDPVEVPAWADASCLRCTWALEKRTLTLTWQARGTLTRSVSGAAAIDLALAKVTKVDALPSTPAGVPKMLERLPLRWHRSIGGQIHAVVEEEAVPATLLRRQTKLVLHVWSETTGKEATVAESAKGTGPELPAELIKGTRPMLLPGLDGLHVWVRDGGSFESAADGAGSAWQVHSALDGVRVARVPFVAGTTQAAVIGTRAYGVVSRSGRVLLEGKAGRRYELYAVDLESGKVLWRKPVKENGASPR